MQSLPIGNVVETQHDMVPPRLGTYVGQTILLRPLKPAEDAESLFAASHGDPARESLWTYMSYGPFDSQPEMLDWLTTQAASADPLFLAVVDQETARAIGMVSFMRQNRPMRVVELGNIWYVPNRHRTVANTEAVYLMLTHAFEQMGCRRVEWKCDHLNEASRRAALRLGFHFEGIFRQHMIIKGRNRDTAWFSMLDSDWPECKKLIQRALDPDPTKRVSLTRLSRQRRANSEPAAT